MPRAAATAAAASSSTRANILAFWLFGICNNVAYVTMLSAAKDILEPATPGNATSACIADQSEAKCSRISTGAVLLADILPSLVVKLAAPFALATIAYNVRILAIVVLQALSLIVVATSSSVALGLFGVMLTSSAAGMGDVTLMAASSHFSSNVIVSWSSGTGAAGIFGAGAYALMTDESLLALSPRTALLSQLVVPAMFTFAFYRIMRAPWTIYMANLARPSTYRIPTGSALYRDLDTSSLSGSMHIEADNDDGGARDDERRHLLASGNYAALEGAAERVIASPIMSASGYEEIGIKKAALIKVGVFVSRTSIGVCVLNARFIPWLAVLQLVNVVIFTSEAMERYIGHIALVFALILYEGTLGGAAFANTFHAVHRRFTRAEREFSMGFVTISDAIGIVAAGLLAQPAHNYICAHYF